MIKVVHLCIMVFLLLCDASGELSPPEKSYNILLITPMAGPSHMNFFISFAEALADRGHKILILSGLPPSSRHPNVMEMNHELPYAKESTDNMFLHRKSSTGGVEVFKTILPSVARDIYKVPSVRSLYERRKEFDLIIIDTLFSEIVYPFVHEVPFVTISVMGMDHRQSAVFGNVLNPSYTPSLLDGYPFPMSLWQRFMNTVMHIWVPFFWRNWAIVPLVQQEISAQFPDLPPLLEIEKNQSLSLVNTHFTITKPVPLLPTQVEVGAMHCRPAKPLPKDLESWITEAGSAGVIYFSLGSLVTSESMPPEYRQAFLEAFRRLPQRILWKYEGELEGASDNVRISRWLPQQDILAHSNVKAFISHGGFLSLQESIFHGTPLLALPVFADQPRNGVVVRSSGLGRVLAWEELNADKIVEAVTDIITDQQYKKNVDRMSATLKDQMTAPQERAIFWTEYVIRHQGAPHLKCSAAELSWVKFLMIDIIGILTLIFLVILLILRRLLQTSFTVSPWKKKED